jgi:D-sedoheptulose 7-phosphate isomerase
VKEKKFFNSFKKNINETIDVKKSLINLSKKIDISIKLITETIENGGKVMLCGNGGSAADAQHLAAEFLIRLRPKVNRSPLPMISLATDTSTVTACGNDYSFSKIFSRPFEALSRENDLLLVISTSGNSKNIIEVLKSSKKRKIKSIGFLGNNGGIAKKFTDIPIIVKSRNVARIQESHIFIGHFILEKVEDNLLNYSSTTI